MPQIRHRQTSGESLPSLFDWPFPVPGWWSRFDEAFRDANGRQLLRVEEFEQDDTLVVRAEMPGIDPDKDVEITLADGMLTIRSERTEEAETSKRHFHRREIRYGAFSRTIALPEGTSDSDIKASYKDGVLEIRIPVPPAHKSEAKRVPIARS
jgi:HSP20 family protein